MRELVYYVAVSIDGYIAAPDGSYDAFPVEGDHMAVYLSDFADALPAHVLAALGMQPPGHRFDTVIQGRASYDVARAAGIERALCAPERVRRNALGDGPAGWRDVHCRRARDGARAEASRGACDLPLRRRKSCRRTAA